MMSENKFILDACCGCRMIWIEKEHPDVLYIDIREESNGFIESRPNATIKPDMQLDFRDLPFPDKKFKLIVWDPPHEVHSDGQARLTGIVPKRYGALHAETWQSDLKRGFEELWRVLDDYGTLIFKFADRSIPFKKVLCLFHTPPLVGTTTKRTDRSRTRWFCFLKSPKLPAPKKSEEAVIMDVQPIIPKVSA